MAINMQICLNREGNSASERGCQFVAENNALDSKFFNYPAAAAAPPLVNSNVGWAANVIPCVMLD